MRLSENPPKTWQEKRASFPNPLVEALNAWNANTGQSDITRMDDAISAYEEAQIVAAQCDEPGCSLDASCGFPTDEGYRRTCHKHSTGGVLMDSSPAWTGTLTAAQAIFRFPTWPDLIAKVQGQRGEILRLHSFTQDDRPILWASGTVSADRKRFSLLLDPVLIEGDCMREGSAYAMAETGYAVRKGYVLDEDEPVMGEKV